MQQIACFTGTVPENFFGNIQYHMELKQPYKSLHLIIDYVDNKDSAGAPSKTLTQSIRNAYLEYYGSPLPDERIPEVYARMKTEIQMTALLDDVFVGTIHRPGCHKEMLITPDEQTPGCVYPKNKFFPGTLQGCLTLIVNFFGVLVDQTPYTLTVFAE